MSSTTSDTTFELGQTVRATNGPTVIVGTVDAYSHHTQPLMVIHPEGILSRFSTIDIWANDGWVIELVEVPA